jgi:hypothetical protein
MQKKITQFVTHLRSQSEETRRHILTMSMVVVGAILVLVWIATLGAFSAAPVQTAEETPTGVKPFDLVQTNFENAWQTVSDGVKGIRSDLTPPDNTPQTMESNDQTPVTATGDTQAQSTTTTTE